MKNIEATLTHSPPPPKKNTFHPFLRLYYEPRSSAKPTHFLRISFSEILIKVSRYCWTKELQIYRVPRLTNHLQKGHFPVRRSSQGRVPPSYRLQERCFAFSESASITLFSARKNNTTMESSAYALRSPRSVPRRTRVAWRCSR